MDDPILAVSDVAFGYPGGPIFIKGLTFTLGAGRRIGVVGASGAGKSTLLHLLTGRRDPTAGVISRAQEVDPGCGGRFGLVAQDDGLFPWRTISENLEVARPDGAGELQVWATQAFAQLALQTDILARYPPGLSIGMRKRVEILRALSASPRLVLADEPFAPLDVGALRASRSFMEMRLAEANGALVLVSHDLATVAEWCHEVLVFAKAEPGRVLRLDNAACGLSADDERSRAFRLQMANAIGML